MDIPVDIEILVYIMPRVNRNGFLFLRWHPRQDSERSLQMIRRHHADAISPFAAKFAAIRPYGLADAANRPQHIEMSAGF
jgi:hypothetical protein